MLRLRPSLAELGGAVAGAGALGLAYAAGRGLGLTRANLAQTLAPDRPSAGRAAQLAIGTLAALPAARARTPTLALAHGAAVGALASREARAFSAAAHAFAALVAQRIAKRAWAPSRPLDAERARTGSGPRSAGLTPSARV